MPAPDEPEDDRFRPSPDWVLPPEPPIHRAARRGDIAELERLIAAGADINERADLEVDNGPHLRALTPLMVAARSIDGATVETLKLLVERGADVQARSEGGDTAAWYTAGHGGRWEFHPSAVTPDHTERLRYLLDQGLDPNETNHVGRSLLVEASRAGDVSRVRLLLERAAIVIPPDPANDADLRWRRALIGDPGRLDGAPEAPASKRLSLEIPLFCAAESGDKECVRLLLESGAPVDLRDASGDTAIMHSGAPGVAELLLQSGADLHAVNSAGADALECILEDACSGDRCGTRRMEVARVLIYAGADIERLDKSGMTRLASAAFGHHVEAVIYLLKAGADPRTQTPHGGTPLHGICWQGEYEDADTDAACERIIEALVEAGATLDARDQHGSTPLHEAAEGDWGNQTAIRALLRLGAHVDPINGEGKTPLMLAASRGDPKCVQSLLQAGADARKADNRGMTALDAARDHLNCWESIKASGDMAVESVSEAVEQGVSAVMADLDLDFGATAFRASLADISSQALHDARSVVALIETHLQRPCGRA